MKVKEKECLKPEKVKLSDLINNKTYFVLTNLNELSEFKYIGNRNIVLPCHTQSFLIDSDQIFTI